MQRDRTTLGADRPEHYDAPEIYDRPESYDAPENRTSQLGRIEPGAALRGESEFKGLSGSALKLIAVVTMILDHIGAVCLEVGSYLYAGSGQAAEAFFETSTAETLQQLDYMLRTIGRISFPIFCFLLVEGFVHTRDVKKYGGRLLLFAFISEVPFDKALFDQWFYPGAQNIFFTLFIGLVTMAGMKRFEGKPLPQLLILAAGCAAAWVLKTDYLAAGILMIGIMYLLRQRKSVMAVGVGILTAAESVWLYCAGVLSLIPICLYNGRRGRLKLKYFFYWFYPVHLAVLYALREAVLYSLR